MEANNMAAMREALEELVANIEMRASTFDIFSIIDRKAFLDAKAALAAPPRNCDMGTFDEQSERFENFCLKDRPCAAGGGVFCAFECPLNTVKNCHLKWAQMPYEAKDGGAECRAEG